MRSAANLLGSDVTGLYPWGEMDEVRGWSSSLEILRDRHDPVGIHTNSVMYSARKLPDRDKFAPIKIKRVNQMN